MSVASHSSSLSLALSLREDGEHYGRKIVSYFAVASHSTSPKLPSERVLTWMIREQKQFVALVI